MVGLKSDFARWDDIANNLQLGEKVITGKGKGWVQAFDPYHKGEYFMVRYDEGKWAGQAVWEHVTSIRRTTLFA